MCERDRRQDATLKAEAGIYAISGLSASIELTSWLLLDWLEIAIRHEHEARLARDRDDAPRERQAAMIAVSACAHCVDGLAWSVEQNTLALCEGRAWQRAHKKGREHEIALTFERGLGVEPDLWLQRLTTLIETLRHPAVHPKAISKPPVRHPDTTREVNVSKETALYSVENATAMVDLVAEVMTRLLDSEATPAQAVASQIRARVEQLVAERKRLADERRGKEPGK